MYLVSTYLHAKRTRLINANVYTTDKTFDNIDWRLRFNLLIINYNSAARNAAAGTFLKGSRCDILWHFFSLPLTTLFSRASPSCNFSPQLRLANAVAVFLINVYLQLATNIASGKLRVLSSLGEYFFAFHCVLYTANSCLKQSVKLKTSLGSVTFQSSPQQSFLFNVIRFFQTYNILR